MTSVVQQIQIYTSKQSRNKCPAFFIGPREKKKKALSFPETSQLLIWSSSWQWKKWINMSCNAAMWFLKAGMISLRQAREGWVSRWFHKSARQPAPTRWLRGQRARQAGWWAGWVPAVTLTSRKTEPRLQVSKVNMETSNSWGKLLREGRLLWKEQTPWEKDPKKPLQARVGPPWSPSSLPWLVPIASLWLPQNFLLRRRRRRKRGRKALGGLGAAAPFPAPLSHKPGLRRVLPYPTKQGWLPAGASISPPTAVPRLEPAAP